MRRKIADKWMAWRRRELFNRNYWCFSSKIDEESLEFRSAEPIVIRLHLYATGCLAFRNARTSKPSDFHPFQWASRASIHRGRVATVTAQARTVDAGRMACRECGNLACAQATAQRFLSLPASRSDRAAAARVELEHLVNTTKCLCVRRAGHIDT